jgi:hypothetical protein
MEIFTYEIVLLFTPKSIESVFFFYKSGSGSWLKSSQKIRFSIVYIFMIMMTFVYGCKTGSVFLQLYSVHKINLRLMYCSIMAFSPTWALWASFLIHCQKSVTTIVCFLFLVTCKTWLYKKCANNIFTLLKNRDFMFWSKVARKAQVVEERHYCITEIFILKNLPEYVFSLLRPVEVVGEISYKSAMILALGVNGLILVWLACYVFFLITLNFILF